MERSNIITSWLRDIKVAIIKKEYSKIETLLDTLPTFETLPQMYEAQALLNEAKILFQEQRDQAIIAMKKNRQAKKYIQSE